MLIFSKLEILLTIFIHTLVKQLDCHCMHLLQMEFKHSSSVPCYMILSSETSFYLCCFRDETSFLFSCSKIDSYRSMLREKIIMAFI